MDSIVQVVGTLISFLVFGAAVMQHNRALVNREIDATMKLLRDHEKKTEESLERINRNISEIRSLYVQKDHHDRDIDSLVRMVTDLKDDLREDISRNMGVINDSVNELRREIVNLLKERK